MGLFAKLFSSGAVADKSVAPSRDEAPDDDEIVLGASLKDEKKGPVEKRGADKRQHPRIVQTTAGGAYGHPRFWVFGGRGCYEDPQDESTTLTFDEANAKAAMPRPDLEGKVELPRYIKMRTEKKQ